MGQAKQPKKELGSNTAPPYPKDWTLIGHVWIDTASVWIGDPCYKESNPELGVESQTGEGDGEYPVYALTNGDGRTTAILCQFMPDFRCPVDDANVRAYMKTIGTVKKRSADRQKGKV